MEPQFHLLIKKSHQEDLTRTNIDRHKNITNSTLSSSMNKMSTDIENLTVDDVRTMKQDIAYWIKVVPRRYSNDPNFKGKPLFLNFFSKCSQSRQSISTCPGKRYTKPLEKPKFQKQSFKQAMKGNQVGSLSPNLSDLS